MRYIVLADNSEMFWFKEIKMTSSTGKHVYGLKDETVNLPCQHEVFIMSLFHPECFFSSPFHMQPLTFDFNSLFSAGLDLPSVW